VNAHAARHGRFAYRRLDDPDRVALLARRTSRLIAGGLNTPAVQPWAGGRQLQTRLIDVPLAEARLGEALRASGGWQAWQQRWLREVMAALGPLHDCSDVLLALPHSDPFARIDSCLEGQGRARRLRERLGLLKERLAPVGRAPGPIHGDFHLRQALLDEQRGCVWILNLDALCLGYPEQDVASLAADAFTTPASDAEPAGPRANFPALLRRCSGAYQASLTGLDSYRLCLFGAIALLRCGLEITGTAAGAAEASRDPTRWATLSWHTAEALAAALEEVSHYAPVVKERD
jgi:hypothetical protein